LTRLSRSTWPLHSRTSAGSVSPTDAPATAYASALLRPLWTPGCSDAHWTLDALAEADTIIVPGRSALTPVPAGVLDALRTAAVAGTRIASICSGTFTLAAAGLLDGLRATTHWMVATALGQQHPADVDPDVLYVDNGQILTSAGAAAGLDLCLHLIRRDYGSAVAADAARLSVMPLEREGGQAQFIVHECERSRYSALARVS
jgi:transcriptional regulator GlxA family with amidase domain